MIEQKITKEIINLSFQKDKFFIYTIGALILFFASAYLIDKFPQIGNFPILILIAYFIPSIIAFDFTEEYKDSLNVPKLNHPKRILILVLNILAGWTMIGWIIALYMALTPGLVEIERVEYIEVK